MSKRTIEIDHLVSIGKEMGLGELMTLTGPNGGKYRGWRYSEEEAEAIKAEANKRWEQARQERREAEERAAKLQAERKAERRRTDPYRYVYQVVVVRPHLEPRKIYHDPCLTLAEAVAEAEDAKAEAEAEHGQAAGHFEYRIVMLEEIGWVPLWRYLVALERVDRTEKDLAKRGY